MQVTRPCCRPGHHTQDQPLKRVDSILDGVLGRVIPILGGCRGICARSLRSSLSAMETRGLLSITAKSSCHQLLSATVLLAIHTFACGKVRKTQVFDSDVACLREHLQWRFALHQKHQAATCAGILWESTSRPAQKDWRQIVDSLCPCFWSIAPIHGGWKSNKKLRIG